VLSVFFTVPLLFGQRNFDISFDVFEKESSANSIKIDVFRCYISSISLLFEDGTIFEEPDSYHLIDKDQAQSMQILLSGIPDKSIAALRYSVGTDSLINVSGAMDGDLDPINGMYWTWNSGYINFKLEGSKTIDNEKHHFEIHIGGYSGAQATARKVNHSITEGNASRITIKVNITAFLNQIDLSANNSVLAPGDKAVSLSNIYQNIFQILE